MMMDVKNGKVPKYFKYQSFSYILGWEKNLWVRVISTDLSIVSVRVTSQKFQKRGAAILEE